MQLSTDTAGVLVGLLSLDDIFALRLTCSWVRMMFKIPPLLTFADFRGDVVCARRHDYLLRIDDRGVKVTGPVCYYYSAAIVTRPPSPPALQGFPTITVGTIPKRHTLKKILGRVLVGLPVYDGSPSRGKYTVAPDGVPLADCCLAVIDSHYGIDNYKFVRVADAGESVYGKHICYGARFFYTDRRKPIKPVRGPRLVGHQNNLVASASSNDATKI